MDEPLCGDPTCEGPGCRQSAIDAWFQRQEEDARDIVNAYLFCEPRPQSFDPEWLAALSKYTVVRDPDLVVLK